MHASFVVFLGRDGLDLEIQVTKMQWKRWLMLVLLDQREDDLEGDDERSTCSARSPVGTLYYHGCWHCWLLPSKFYKARCNGCLIRCTS